jgi:signal transduction histidine kinase
MMTANQAMTQADKLGEAQQMMENFEQLEVQFQQIRQQLTHSHRLATLGTIASVVAHEFNNILTPMVSYGQLALANPDDHDLMRKAVEKSLLAAERAACISASLLGFARDQDDQPALSSLPHTIDQAIATLARHPKKDGMEVNIDVPDIEVAITPLNLQQVLLNLILNARKAMRRKGGTLSILGQVEQNSVHVQVRDTGPGIPPQIIDRLFEPFVTHRIGEDENLPEHDKGTGLGLCLCRDLLEAAGGSIRAESAPSEGAVFHLIIPLPEALPQSKSA